MRHQTVDHARDALVLSGHAMQATGVVVDAIPLPCAKTASKAMKAAGVGLVKMADTVCSEDRGLATRDCPERNDV